MGLARKVSPFLLLFFGLGNILGAGIYVLLGKVAEVSGYYTPLSFIIALIIVSFTALSYSELASRFPVASGVAAYMEEGLHKRWLSLATGLAIVLAGLVSAAAIANGFSGYFNELFAIPRSLSMVLLLCLIGAVAIWGIGESVKIAMLFTLVEIGGLLIIIIAGAPALSDLPMLVERSAASWEWDALPLITVGAFLAFYAFLGFEDIVHLAEEVKTPNRSMPLAILLALGIATLLYILVSLVAVSLIPPSQLAATDAPFAELYKAATGSQDAVLITVISMFAIVNGALIQIVMASRILYGMSIKGWLPIMLSQVNDKTKTPVVATTLVTAVTMLMALIFPLVELAQMTSAIILVIFTAANLALIRIKKRHPNPSGVFCVPIFVPITATALNLLFLGFEWLA